MTNDTNVRAGKGQSGQNGHLNTPRTPMTRDQKKRAKLIAGTVGGPALLLIGIILHAVTSGTVSACNGTLGQFGQALDQQAAEKCATANTVSSVGTWLIWLGIIIAIGGVAGLYFMAKEAQKAAAQKAAAQKASAPKVSAAPRDAS